MAEAGDRARIGNQLHLECNQPAKHLQDNLQPVECNEVRRRQGLRPGFQHEIEQILIRELVAVHDLQGGRG